MTEEQSIGKEDRIPDVIDATVGPERSVTVPAGSSMTAPGNLETQAAGRRSVFVYIMLPIVFLTAALLGGLRLSDPGGELVFLRPALICLVFTAVLVILFARGGLISFVGWFAEDRSGLSLVANAAVMLSLFAASVQLFNSLLPERGIPFWVVGFCFFWTLWGYLFAEFDARRLIRSLGALFGMAFVVKYLVLANITAPASESWLQGILQNPSKEALTWLFDLPRYSGGTGYVQFFTLVLYLAGLYLLPRSAPQANQSWC